MKSKDHLGKIKSFFALLYKCRFTTVAGAWVYYFLISLIPLVFLFVTAFSWLGVSVSSELVSRLPAEFREAGEAILKTAESARGGATVFFTVTVFLSCTKLLDQMSVDGDVIYGTRSHIKRGILRKLWAISAILFLFLMFLALAFVFAFKNMILSVTTANPAFEIILPFVTFSVAILFGYVIIILLNKFISPVRLKIKNNLLGSLVSLFVIVTGTVGFMIYLRFFTSLNLFYGSLTAIIIFLLWSYIVMTGLTLGVIVNKGLYEREKKKVTAETSGKKGEKRKKKVKGEIYA